VELVVDNFLWVVCKLSWEFDWLASQGVESSDPFCLCEIAAVDGLELVVEKIEWED